ncbi:interleukin-10 receptor subunit alpha [Mastacembelus armatus]|uniref:Interleukin 10 receptor, alpha n=1 Tax=Mastacembelus armatus TaxID=205130 RepID=A0A3Q3M2U9_9TELE|nr:interferon gamma receptor 1 [Mastacembelus armatus]
MMKSLWTPKMDLNKTPILGLLIIYISCVSGLDIPQPDNITVNILDGEVTVYWKQPARAPPSSQYNVEMAKYYDEWARVDSCTGIIKTYCDLSNLIHDYRGSYKVRVQLVAGDDTSPWTKKKFLLTESELQPPSFSLQATSSTLTIYIYQKPILRKLFPYGLTYSIYLEEKGQNNKNITEYLKDEVDEEQRIKTFSSLHWGKEYCISIKIQGSGALHPSSVSPKRCLTLPEQEWFIIAVSSLSTLGGLVTFAIMAAIFLCYLKRPVKTPAALKSAVSGWLPLSVGEGTMEVVTDKGWFLSSYKTEVENCIKDPVTQVMIADTEEEERRTSMDSGISMVSNSAINNRGSPPMKQEDSGCGSLGGPESSTSGQTDYPLQDKKTGNDTVQKREDSGVGLGLQLNSSSINQDGQDSGPLKESVNEGNYHRQTPSIMQIHVLDDEEAFKQTLPDTDLAEVVTGYRAGPQACICSGAGQCTWCHKQGHYGSDVIKQYRAMCIENGLLNGKCDFVDSYKAGLTFSSYASKAPMDAVMIDDLEKTFIQLGETFPLLTALSSMPLVEESQDFNMNNLPLSLCDVQLKTED